jgi:Ca2+-binding EF-hand superfamily protein
MRTLTRPFIILSACAPFALSGVAHAQTAQSAQPAQTVQTETASDPLDRATFIQQMDAEFARLDLDSSGYVVPEEIIESQRRAAQSEALRQNQAVFVRLDSNGDGAVSAQEFAALANPDALPVDATPLMTQFDSDRDEVITLVEYRIATQANFDRIDSDRDGVVTSVEMRAAGIAP